MNNTEALKKAYLLANMPNDDTTLKEFIDEIYQDFNNRICNNCKYYHQKWVCLEIGNGNFFPDKNFGCNHFKQI